MTTFEVLLAFGAAGIFICIYRARRLKEQRQSLRWFYTKQANQLTTQSEIIREDLLQQSFALRRALELGALESSTTINKQWEVCLNLIQDFNQSLENLSNELLPPFVEDSLPLALQHLIHQLSQQWEPEQTLIQISLDLPSDWPQQAPHQHRMILWCVRECLMMLNKSANQHLYDLSLSLVKTDGIATLHLSLTREGLKSNRQQQFVDLHHMQQVFQVMMPGRCHITHNKVGLDCKFSWSLAHI